MSIRYIELKRTFHEISIDGGDRDEFDYKNLRIGKKLNWQDLLTGYRILILSEAGAGKTEEIRHSAQTLRKEGKSAFFLRLEHMDKDFDIAFEEGSSEEFELWLATDGEGWLFLDSVDESRLRDPLDFERAIRRVGSRLGSALQRTHIVLSSRGSAWRPVTDLNLCQLHLRYFRRSSNDHEREFGISNEESTTFMIVALDDLEQEQVELFAKAKGISEPRPFLEAIDRLDSWSLVSRPDDLGELVDYWIKNKSIGNRLDLMQSSIARRLAERDQNREEAFPLSAIDARSGARSVAAAATLTQESTIRVPDGSKNTKGFSVSDVLPDWDSKRCAALLARPIFDEAIYQTVRFHHRTVREYLVAEWFNQLLSRETSRRKIESLFFREQYGQQVIVPTMRPVLLWLILFDDSIRQQALSISPELIFEGGEPKALPRNVRQKILRDVCEHISTGVTRDSANDYRAVQRFADTDFAADIKVLFAKYAANDDVQYFLLRMIWQGELSVALPEARAVALNPNAGHYSRIAAFRAIRAVATEAVRSEIRDFFLKESPTLNCDWLSELVQDLPSTKQSVEWVLSGIAKLKPKDRYNHDGLSEALDSFVHILPLELVAELLEGLASLLSMRPVVERHNCEISNRHGRFLKSAAHAVERLVVARDAAALQRPTLSVLRMLPAAKLHHDWHLRDVFTELPKLIPEWPELNHSLFWYEVAQVRRFRQRKLKERIFDFWQVSFYDSYWRFGPSDFQMVLSDITLRSGIDDRLVALSLAFHLYREAKRPRKWREALKSAVAGSSVLRTALSSRLNPTPQTAEDKSLKKRMSAYRERNRVRDASRVSRESKWKEDLIANVELLRDHKLIDPLAISNRQRYVFEKMQSLDQQSSDWTEGNWQVLKAEFGDEVALAFRDGIVAYWRRHIPKLRSEGKSDNSITLRVLFGLTGLNIEARETANWASTLLENEAEIAFRYGMEKLNGFPDWLPSLSATFPSLISELLLREVDRDLRIEKVNVDTNYALSDLSWTGSWAWPSISRDIFDRLKAREPKNLNNLSYMLNIIVGGSIPRLEIASLAESRSSDRRIAHATSWYAVWTGIDPAKAILSVAARLKRIKDQRRQANFAMQFVTRLLGGRRSVAFSEDAFRVPAHLKSLYLLMNQYIKVKDDINRAGKGVYSPGLRDDAQDARNKLFFLLKEIPGKEAYLALMELAQLHPEPTLRPWMLHHAKTKAESDAALTRWSVKQTLEFQEMIERTPTNHRELFELAEMRFLDLKVHMEHGDSSIADILIRGATQETEMRKFIGEWLRNEAQGRYSIPQEEELADAKRMDLRMHGMGFDEPVPIELKLAEKWSASKLLERLENQLCGDYLRDIRSNRGLYILVRGDNKKQWQLPEGKETVDFDGLVFALQRHWLAISNRFPSVEEIRVIGIDLARRRNKVQT